MLTAPTPTQTGYTADVVRSVAEMIDWVFRKINSSTYDEWRTEKLKEHDRIVVTTMYGVNLWARQDDYEPIQGPDKDLYVEPSYLASFDRMLRDACSHWSDGRRPSRSENAAWVKLRFRGVIWHLG